MSDRLNGRTFLLGALAATPAAAQWAQWGGPNGDFRVSVRGLAASWPEQGPPRIWSRELGEGYSGIVVDDGVLYTMYRRGEQEVVLAAWAHTGETIWEHAYPIKFMPSMNMEQGPGPHASPLVSGKYLVTAGVVGRLSCLDRETGKPVWHRDLYREFSGTRLPRGYACSPIALGERLIVKVGGPGHALMSLDVKTGEVLWRNGDFDNSVSSPLHIKIGGLDVIVAFLAEEIAGFDAVTGDVYFTQRHRTRFNLNISTPVYGDDGILFCSSGYDAGSRALRLKRVGGGVEAKELWFSNQMRVHFTNAVRVGKHIVASSGDFGPAPLTAIDVETGEIAWRDRSFAKANLVQAGNRLVVLDENGVLGLASVTPQGLTVHDKSEVLTHKAWTAPTMVEKVVFLRDQKSMMALDLKA